MPQLVRVPVRDGGVALGVLDPERALMKSLPAPHTRLSGLLGRPLEEIRRVIEDVLAGGRAEQPPSLLLPPVDEGIEVWAAGVTYKRSEEARVEESATPDIYTKVYRAERPELFFKASARRVAGDGQPLSVRADSTWDVPEPELALVVNARAEIVGFTIANDVSSRSIEGDNPLYLPQAKVYAACCALGPGITPVWEVPDPYTLGIRMTIERAGGTIWRGETNTAELKRRFEELVEYLFREDDFPGGVILSTGTALVPDAPFTLEDGDTVQIEIDYLGRLRNGVVRGKARLASAADNVAAGQGSVSATRRMSG